MNQELHFWTVEDWVNRVGDQNYNAFSIWASPKFMKAAKEAMVEMDEGKAQVRARVIIRESGRRDFPGEFHHWLKFRPEVGLAHIAVPGNACGLDLYFESEALYEQNGFTLLPHNIDTPGQQSTLFAIWLWWAKCVEAYV